MSKINIAKFFAGFLLKAIYYKRNKNPYEEFKKKTEI